MQDRILQIALMVAGFAALTFGLLNEAAHGWGLDIVNIVTIVVAIVLIGLGIFTKSDS